MSAKGLGRGLSALFGDDPVVEDVSSSGSTLRISDIEPNPGQPRRHFDPEALQTLAESILRSSRKNLQKNKEDDSTVLAIVVE